MTRFWVAVLVLASGCESRPNVDWAPGGGPDAPSIPVGMTLTPDHESVTVRWTANPTEDLVETYLVYSAAEPWQTWSNSLAGSARTEAVCCELVRGDLPNEQQHFFAVAAANAQGEGAAAPPQGVAPPGWLGSLQGGTPGNDQGFGVVAGRTGDLYAVGSTDAALDGEAPLGLSDAFIVHYRLSGNRLWTRLLGTPGDDLATATAVDAAGNVLVVGYTNGAFPTYPAQSFDAFLAKFFPDGTLAWVRQFGSPGGDFANSVAVVGTNSICVVGNTDGNLDGESNAGMNDAFVTLYDAGGTRQWTHLVGTTAVEIGTAAGMREAGKCYAAGHTTGGLSGANLGGNDAFVAEFIAGGQIWVRQFGSGASDTVGGVVADDSRDRVYVSGLTSGSFGGETLSGTSDPFVVAYDRSGGTIDWTTYIGGSSAENVARVALQFDGRPVAAFYAFQPVSSADVVVAQLSTAGVMQWSSPIATGALDYLGGVSTDDYGNAYVSGYTYGAIGAPNAGLWDHFIAKLGTDGTVR